MPDGEGSAAACSPSESAHSEPTAIAGGGLLVHQSHTKEVKVLLEDVGWLCKSPGHKISAYNPSGLMLLPLTSEASGAIVMAATSVLPLSTAGDDIGAPRHPVSASQSKLMGLIADGTATHIASETLPLPPVPPLRQQTRKRKSSAPDHALQPEIARADRMRSDGAAIEFVELFAGIGGFRLGMEAVGCTCVFASEVDPEARQTYVANFDILGEQKESEIWSKQHLLAGDITRIHSCHVPPHDILTAGFPCQSFSSAGRQEGLSSASSGHLFFHVVRILQEKQPRAFLLENVKGLTTMNNGETFQTVLRLLRQAGYAVWHKLIDAAALLPQTRMRVYIVGFREDVAPEAFDFPEIPDLGRQAQEVLQDLPSANPYQLSDHQWSKVQSSQYYAKHPGARLLEPLGHAQTLQSSYRSSYMLYSQFVPTACQDGAAEDPPRFFTPRECARLMGFPESFDLGGSDGSDCMDHQPDSHGRIYRQLGNAACAPVVAAIAGCVVACLRDSKSASESNTISTCHKLKSAMQLVMDALPADARAKLAAKNRQTFIDSNM